MELLYYVNLFLTIQTIKIKLIFKIQQISLLFNYASILYNNQLCQYHIYKCDWFRGHIYNTQISYIAALTTTNIKNEKDQKDFWTRQNAGMSSVNIAWVTGLIFFNQYYRLYRT